MRVILIVPPRGEVSTSIQPLLGVAYLASVLREKGADVEVINADIEFLSVNQIVGTTLSLEPDIIGISITTPTFSVSAEIIEQIRASTHSKIMVGGPHPTLFPEDFLQSGVDYVIRGEGETTCCELYDSLTSGKRLDKIDGLSFMENGRIIHNPNRSLISDLDTLPYPAWDLYPIRKFKNTFRKGFSLPIMTSRGCPFRCIFCYKRLFGNKYRARKPANIVDEIEYLVKEFTIEEFVIIDDNFTLQLRRAMEICDLIVERGLEIPWSLPAGIRVDSVSTELMNSLKRAGCYRIGFGIESGNQRVLDYIGKKVTLEEAERALSLTKSFNIETIGFFMLGNLEEDEGTMEDTVRFALKLDPDFAQFTKATPYPGTRMYDILKEQGRLRINDWGDFDSFLSERETFAHPNLSTRQIDSKLREAYKRFYYRPKIIFRYLRKIRNLREFANLFRNFFLFLKRGHR